jgi:mevalonate kinase
MGKGTGFGKTILIGDQFVLEEVPAIVSAIAFETEATVERCEGKGWALDDNRPEVPGYKASKRELQAVSIDRILEVMGIDPSRTPIRITLGGTLLAGSGVGASAASCVSLARALNEEFGLGLPIDQINRIAWEGEFAYHGIPSGVDNTASCYGGLLLYRIRNGEKGWERIRIAAPIDVVLGNSGVSADTRLLDGLVEKEKEEDPQLFRERMETITGQSLRMKEGLERGALEEVGRLMVANHRILGEMGLSHERLDHLCRIALGLGAPGAKLTGGGMGGYMVALTPGKRLQERVAGAMEQEGFHVIRTRIGKWGQTSIFEASNLL